MEGKCLKCRYHELVIVNFVCQLRLSYAVAANSPRISVAYDHKGLSLTHAAFPLQVSRGFIPCHLYSVTQVEGVGSSVTNSQRKKESFVQKQHFCSHVFAKASHVTSPKFNKVPPGQNITGLMATYNINTRKVIFLQKRCQVFWILM